MFFRMLLCLMNFDVEGSLNLPKAILQSLLRFESFYKLAVNVLFYDVSRLRGDNLALD